MKSKGRAKSGSWRVPNGLTETGTAEIGKYRQPGDPKLGIPTLCCKCDIALQHLNRGMAVQICYGARRPERLTME